ncbi:MAG: hypothetical protein AAGB93_07060 [Planctomycetota bacterium]
MSDALERTGVDRAGRRRRLLFRLRRAVRVIEQRERIQDIGYGLLAAAFALSLPAARPYTAGDEVLRRMAGEDVLTQGLLYPIGRGALEVFGTATPETTMRLLAGLAFGAALTMTLAFLRGLGFRRSATVPSALAAFAAPYAWLGGTSPVDYAPGMFGASLLLWSLFHQEQSTKRGYHWRAILSFGLAYMLHMEIALLVPAVAWAVARHPEYRREAQLNFYAVVVVLVMSIAIGLAGTSEAARITHLAERALAGADDFGLGALARWLVALPLGFGIILFGVYQLLFASRQVEAKRAPIWIVPWCMAALAPVVAGSPEFEPIAPYLVPAGALGLADWLNRRGTAAREGRYGMLLVGIQLVATGLVLTLS